MFTYIKLCIVFSVAKYVEKGNLFLLRRGLGKVVEYAHRYTHDAYEEELSKINMIEINTSL